MNELVERAKNGDKEAFTEIFLIHRNNLLKLAKAKVGNEEDAKDIVQETLEQAYLSIRKLKASEYFKPWITKILINKCKEFYKKKGVREKTLKGYISEQKINEKENFIEKTEEDIDFNLLLRDLKEEERIIVLLFYNGKYTTKEISYILGVNENTIKSRLNRAKNKIRINKKEENINGQDRQIYSKSSE